MYINDIHILNYVLVGIIGLFVGQFVDWCNEALPKNKKIFSKDFFTEYLKHYKPKYILMTITAIMYVVLLYMFGISLEFLKYMVLVPMLLSVFCIDLKLQIIPNRLNLTLFETGLLFTFITTISDTSRGLNVFSDSIIGMLVGGGIFLIINVIGGIIAGKEAMGFGDVKLMGALGLFFGWFPIIIVSVIAFLLAAIISIGILIFKRKKSSEYIPFGPFIVAACFILMFTPFELLLTIVFKIFTLGLYRG